MTATRPITATPRSTAGAAVPRARVLALLLCWSLVLLSSNAFAQRDGGVADPAPRPPAVARDIPLAQALSQRGDLTLRNNTSMSDALLTISELWKINIVAGEVPGSVYGVFKDAPLKEILDSILISNGYGYRSVGESLVVSKLEQLGQVNPFFESATIVVRAAKIEDVVAGAQLLSTPQGQVRAVPSASSIFVLDFPDRVKMIREFAESVDAAARRASGSPRGVDIGEGPEQLQVAYLKTHYIAATDAEPVLTTVLSPAGRVAAMESENRLLAVDYAENLKMVATVLERIDRPRPQVSVRALIYDISLQDMEELGLNWQSLGGGNSSPSVTGGTLTPGTLTSGTGSFVNSIMSVPPTDGSANGTFSFFTLNSNFNLSAVAVALQQATDSRLLASPNVRVLDNTEATIESVQEIPFQQLTQTSGGGNIGTTAFRDAGITLRVTPKIALDGTIEMDVAPEFSRLTGFTPGDNQPIIDRRTATTTVRIADGQTIVIAGLRQRSDVGDFKGLPFLKDVRFFGHLFRARETDIRESELVVFINPTIVGYEGPLSPRDQCTADTIDCRLDLIPQAEGCPGGCARPCGPGYTACDDGSAVAVPAEGLPAGNSGPDYESGDESILPMPPEQPQPANEDGLVYPELSHAPGVRRLPLIHDEAPPQVIVSRRDERQPAGRTAARPMRRGYDSRYRASGEGFPSAADAAPSANRGDAKAKPRTVFGRIFRR